MKLKIPILLMTLILTAGCINMPYECLTDNDCESYEECVDGSCQLIHVEPMCETQFDGICRATCLVNEDTYTGDLGCGTEEVCCIPSTICVDVFNGVCMESCSGENSMQVGLYGEFGCADAFCCVPEGTEL